MLTNYYCWSEAVAMSLYDISESDFSKSGPGNLSNKQWGNVVSFVSNMVIEELQMVGL